ncbi:MAG: hypothetical protein HOH04_07895 [Rhodospirillaceae bacterium]|jgi:flagellar basal body-associated protein FliL|nr:hypothetical protein [Rhodospirillaceae bacterium]
MRRTVLIFFVLLGVVAANLQANAAEGKKKEQSLREKFALPSHVQMSPMMVPINHPHTSTSVITVFLEPVHREAVGNICRNVPRIRDAILRLLSRNPIQTQSNKMQLDGLADQFVPIINKVLEKEKIKGVHVEPGMVNLGRGGGISRLPFATVNGCRGIKEIEEKLKAAAEKAKEKQK